MTSETKMASFVSGALVGLSGMALSGVSNAVCRTKLGYEQISVVNLIQVGVLTGLSSSLVLFIQENGGELLIQFLRNKAKDKDE